MTFRIGVISAVILAGVMLTCARMAQAQPVLTLTDSQPQYNLTPYLDILEDPGKQLTITDVTAPAFTRHFVRHHGQTLGYGLSNGGYWLRFRLQQQSRRLGGQAPYSLRQIMILDLNTPWISAFALYPPTSNQSNKNVAHRLITAQRAVNSAATFGRTFIAELPPHFQQSEPFYLYLECLGPLNMPIYLWSASAFQRHNIADFFGFGIFYGFLGCMILFNLWLFISLRDRRHLYYAFQMSALFLYQFGTFGHGAAFIPFRLETWCMLLYVFFGVVTFCSVIFNMTFLETKVQTPRLHLLLHAYLLISLIAIGLGLTKQFYMAQVLSSTMGLFFPVLSVTIGIICFRQGFQPARYFLIAWGIMLIGIFLWSLRALGFIPHLYLLTYVFSVCSAFEALFLSFALADRIGILQQEKERLKISEHHYQHLSCTDELTKLYNKRYLLNQLHHEIVKAHLIEQPLALIMLDMDNFKRFNDTYGHPAGDVALETLGLVIRECIRDSDHGCRYGGEEFVVILPHTAEQIGFIVAERIRQKFSARAFCVAPEISAALTVSLGVSVLRPADDAQRFLKRTDEALYQAKFTGKNRTVIAASS